MVEIFSRTNLFRGPLRAVILGWSGVAVDHGAFGSIQPYIDAFRQSWVEISAEDVRQHLGLSYSDHLLALLQSESVSSKWLDIYGVSPIEYDLDRLYRNIEQLMPAEVLNHAEPVPGLLETVAEFRHRELKIGSTSSHSYGAMEALAEAAKERGYQPDAMVCSSDVPDGRPYPWMCYQNAINLEAYPLEALVKIGDTLPGIQEGLNAGMWTIGVLKTSAELGLTVEEITQADADGIKQRLDVLEKKFLDAGAHFVVESIRDCPAVIDQINQRLKHGEKP